MRISLRRSIRKRAPQWYEGLTALKCTMGYNVHGAYCVPESSMFRPAAQAILSREVWEPETIAFILQHCGSGDIVHAGTYFGDFLPALSKGSNAKIWAFEPNRENYRCAEITCKLNDLQNVLLLNAGLGDRPERRLLCTFDESRRGVLGGNSYIASEGDQEVEIVRIDDIVNGRNVSVIQLDVEGYERLALQGAIETVRRCQPALVLEIERDVSLIASEWFRENILNLGYRRAGDLHGNAAFLHA